MREDQSDEPMGATGQVHPVMMGEARERRLDLKRKDELFGLAKGIAAQVSELTRRHERCLLRQMVEMLLDH